MFLPKQLKDKQPYKDDSDNNKKQTKMLVDFVVVFDENSRSMTRMYIRSITSFTCYDASFNCGLRFSMLICIKIAVVFVTKSVVENLVCRKTFSFSNSDDKIHIKNTQTNNNNKNRSSSADTWRIFAHATTKEMLME